MKKLALGAIVLSSIATSAARGQDWNFWTQCATGAFHACASVSISFQNSTFEQGGLTFDKTTAKLRLANSQGTLPAGLAGNAGTYLTRLQFNNILAFNVMGEGDEIGQSMTAFGNAGGNAFFDSWIGLSEILGSDPATNKLNVSFFDMQSTVTGCDGDHVSPFYSIAWTCGGALEFTWDLIGKVQFDKTTSVTLQFADLNPATSTGTYLSCTSGVDCVTVTPEPISLLLLGSGLAAVGGMALRRSRRRA